MKSINREAVFEGPREALRVQAIHGATGRQGSITKTGEIYAPFTQVFIRLDMFVVIVWVIAVAVVVVVIIFGFALLGLSGKSRPNKRDF
jgi:uncharacterized membrane protein